MEVINILFKFVGINQEYVQFVQFELMIEEYFIIGYIFVELIVVEEYFMRGVFSEIIYVKDEEYDLVSNWVVLKREELKLFGLMVWLNELLVDNGLNYKRVDRVIGEMLLVICDREDVCKMLLMLMDKY